MVESKNKFGVLYVATGQTYVDEALASARSLKKHNPQLPVTLISDLPTTSNYIDSFILIKDPQFEFIDKVNYFSKTPYENTLFLDTDTVVCDKITEIFEALEHFDLGIAHVPNDFKLNFKPNSKVPSSFIEFNTGVILYKKSEEMNLFFKDWKKNWQQKVNHLRTHGKRGYGDQAPFREALYSSKLRFFTLPQNYNIRGRYGCINGVAKIIHSRMNSNTLSKLVKEITRTDQARIFFSAQGKLEVVDCSVNNLINLRNNIIEFKNKIIIDLFIQNNFPKSHQFFKKRKNK